LYGKRASHLSTAHEMKSCADVSESSATPPVGQRPKLALPKPLDDSA
jgi:hypothetical protein